MADFVFIGAIRAGKTALFPVFFRKNIVNPVGTPVFKDYDISTSAQHGRFSQVEMSFCPERLFSYRVEISTRAKHRRLGEVEVSFYKKNVFSRQVDLLFSLKHACCG